jgi:hypothetical protein
MLGNYRAKNNYFHLLQHTITFFIYSGWRGRAFDITQKYFFDEDLIKMISIHQFGLMKFKATKRIILKLE